MVVAINKYSSAPLRGCVADGRAMVDFMREKLHVPASGIVTLFDEAASRAAILSMFRKHFTENEQIAKGDGMVFYYAGHGARAYAPEDWHLNGDQVECICPYDSDWSIVHGIPCTTLNALFRELAYHKGDNIVSFWVCARRLDGIADATNLDRHFRLLSLWQYHAERLGNTLHVSASKSAPADTLFSGRQCP